MSNTSRDNGVTRNDSERSETRRTNNTSGNLSSRPQQSDGSSTIRRTLIERGVRPVGSSGDDNLSNGHSSTIAAITTRTKQHEDEQRELQELNAKFSIYLDRVQYLEDFNKQLSIELNNLRQAWGGEASQLQESYGPQLQALRDAINNAINDQTLRELQLKRAEYDLWQVKRQIAAIDGDSDTNRLNSLKQQLDASAIELEQSKHQFDQRLSDLARQRSIMENALNELDGLNNELDNHQIERIIMENELQTLREHAAFQDAIYQAQREEILTLDTPVLDVSGFYRSELARAISDIRQDFEVLSQSQVNELEEYYHIKTEQVREEIASENERKRLLASEGVVDSMDKVALSSSLKDHQGDLIALQTENRQLQAEFDAIGDDLEKILEEHSREKQSYNQELALLRQDIDNRKATIDELLENNVSLRFEMSTYRRLLDVEEKHLNRMEQGQDFPSLPPTTSSTSSYRVVHGQDLPRPTTSASSSYGVEQGLELSGLPRPTSSYRVEAGQPSQSSPRSTASTSHGVEQGLELSGLPRPTSSYRVEAGQPLQSSPRSTPSASHGVEQGLELSGLPRPTSSYRVEAGQPSQSSPRSTPSASHGVEQGLELSGLPRPTSSYRVEAGQPSQSSPRSTASTSHGVEQGLELSGLPRPTSSYRVEAGQPSQSSPRSTASTSHGVEQGLELSGLPRPTSSYREEAGQPLQSSPRSTPSASHGVEQGLESSGLPRPTSSASSPYRVETGQPLQSSPEVSSYQNQQTPNRGSADLGTKKMTVQKTARGPISFESVDLETDTVTLINEKYSGSDQSFRNWTIRRQIDQQPEIVYQFPSTFSLRPRQTICVSSRGSSQSARSTGSVLVADNIETWGQGRKMITRLIDDNNDEKAIITQIFQ